ncbi:MAG: hypothetical protein M3R67_13690, partial [Acidobacteriota bacterium]|nr:hypothetical protein [Acidobacteriota bacterium]
MFWSQSIAFIFMFLFYFFALVVIWLGLISLRGGLSFASYVRHETSTTLPDFSPFVSVIAPNRGLDDGLRENIAALLKQDYPAYEIIFITDRADDPSLSLINELITAHSGEGRVFARVVIAGDAIDSGQKVHNLRVAVLEADPRSEVLVFVDTDGRTDSSWLRSLV